MLPSLRKLGDLFKCTCLRGLSKVLTVRSHFTTLQQQSFLGSFLLLTAPLESFHRTEKQHYYLEFCHNLLLKIKTQRKKEL